MIAQGLIDEESHARGYDALTPLHRASLAFCRGGAAPQTPIEHVTIKEPEGYAFYAVYPEMYAMAARALPPSPNRLVIGIRTIGTSLGAAVAGGCGARD